MAWPVKSRFIGGLAGALMLGLPSTAIATPVVVQPQAASGVAQIRLSLGELFQNVFRYIQVSTISDQEEVELGRQINQMVLSQQYQLYNNRQVQQYVDRVGQRLVAASDSRDIPFTFQVVASDEVNAFATPGGFVYVTTGLLQEADNEAQLASVLAHEIAHINERHSVQALRRAVLAQGIAETAGVEMNALAQVGYQVAFELPRSRDYEYAADAAGLQILQAAGYPPQAFVNFLEQLMDSSAQPEFLRTHPTGDSRIRELQSQYSSSANAPRQGTSTNAYQEAISPLY
ncbi:M48 family metalloprotease [Nodosilinea sp. LEGE 07298]|uniref:M48 family metallopeptidase n=1 Tax=Nodosilinea sp. LEGE 07298 TaxID=2777970 RepID=UPI001881A89F|nr:M48 family metallopeptidase [Nodosilinea sp. LEGE 07298]MBE9113831.1 M48 family metalloprotease [Nodosilinea sp. LEGE 07298]